MIHTDGRRTIANAPARPSVNPSPPAKARKPLHGGYPNPRFGESRPAPGTIRMWGRGWPVSYAAS